MCLCTDSLTNMLVILQPPLWPGTCAVPGLGTMDGSRDSLSGGNQCHQFQELAASLQPYIQSLLLEPILSLAYLLLLPSKDIPV